MCAGSPPSQHLVSRMQCLQADGDLPRRGEVLKREEEQNQKVSEWRQGNNKKSLEWDMEMVVLLSHCCLMDGKRLMGPQVGPC